MRNMGVFSADLPGRLSPEASPKLPRPWASKLAHVNSVRPEPRRLVGKICSVHVFENINKSHRYEIIVSQVAWIRRGGGGKGGEVDSWKRARAADIGRGGLGYLGLCWQRALRQPFADVFAGAVHHANVTICSDGTLKWSKPLTAHLKCRQRRWLRCAYRTMDGRKQRPLLCDLTLAPTQNAASQPPLQIPTFP